MRTSNMLLTERLVRVTVYGPSMTPSIPSGSQVLLDLSAKQPQKQAIVAFKALEGDLYLHRVLSYWAWRDSTPIFLESGDGDDVYTLVSAERIIATAVVMYFNGRFLVLPSEPSSHIGSMQKLLLCILARLCSFFHIRWLQALCGLIFPTLIMRFRNPSIHYGFPTLLQVLRRRALQIINRY